MRENIRRILITGGAGFIGSHVVRRWVNRYPDTEIYNLDALTYAGNLENLRDIESAPNYHFLREDIRDGDRMKTLFHEYGFDAVIHLAAESHVDRSITGPMAFIETNILGTVHLLNAARHAWSDRKEVLFYHISTDEVFGSLGETGLFSETTPYDPRSPYSASKASSDHLVRAYHHTYGLPIIVSNCSNNYGPYQFPEKLIPLTIHHLIHNQPIPVYGDGLYTRDWLFVEDHAAAIDTIFHRGLPGETYNIGGNNEWKNIDLVSALCDIADELLGRPAGSSRELITFVKDRPGHDRRYAIDATKLQRTLQWEPSIQSKEGFYHTFQWYLNHPEWLEHVTSGSYQQYYAKQYS